MIINLLEKNYIKNETIYKDFMNNTIDFNGEYFSNELVEIENAPDFPIYMGKGRDEYKEAELKRAINIIMSNYIDTKRDIHFDQRFWHSLLLYKRDYIIGKYRNILKSNKDFYNIVFKKFNWENYIYKAILAAEYIFDSNYDREQTERYVDLVVKNLDIFNYIIKYRVFKNRRFVMNLLTVIDQEKLSDIFKSKIMDENVRGDVRYGRQVLFEFNKNYPVIMYQYMNVEELTKEVLQTLELYL